MTVDSKIRVHVTHCDPVFEAGVVAILSREPGLQVLQSIDAAHADLYVADHVRGMALAASLQIGPARAEPEPSVLIISDQAREWDLRHALNAGVHGYLAQGCEVLELLDAVRALSNGRRYVSRQLSDFLADSVPSAQLTARESDVLQLVAAGLCNKQVSAQLDLALGTVKSHIKAVFTKLGVNSRTRAIFVATQRGLVTPPDARRTRTGDIRSVPMALLAANAGRGSLVSRRL